ncbi:substrate-binding periplasmic protein [Alteromonas oceanisediminis]|uniref:substrate-binding periplasmic protein n=1 Tax=Alteromonas oceanisediminis TaxID=2836180 RepID=UPI001BDA1DEA|nr:transporter substrate-binding domain-containing protein [Alteromonas oceanisediminis]MBT0586985.1 transporter substrate-binding domain-containing protein [Alteromonas oceanisediminis]
MKILVHWICVWVLLCSVAGKLDAAEKSTPEAQTLGVYSSILPVFSEQLANGEPAGYSIEFAQGILKSAGYNADIVQLPFARLMREMSLGPAAVATGVGRIPEREDQFFWIAPMTANVIGLFAKSGRIDPNLTQEQLSQLRSVAVLRGDYRVEILNTLNVPYVLEVNTWTQAVKAVLKDRVDAVFLSDLGIGLTCRTANLACDSLQKIYTHNVLFSYLVMPKVEGNRAHAIALGKAAQRYVLSREFEALTQRWIPALQQVADHVEVRDGVVSMGRIDEKANAERSLWVLTSLEPGFSERDERGTVTGYAAELVKGILTEAGLPQTILAAPWQRILIESQMKSDVLVFSIARTPEREDDFYWISPISANAYSLFGRWSSNEVSQKRIQSLKELPSQTSVAVLAGDFRERQVVQAGLTAHPSETTEQAFLSFMQGQSDYFYSSESGLFLLCKRLAADCADVKRVFTTDITETYLAVSRKGTSPELVRNLTRAANTFKRSNEYHQLADNWLATFAQREMPPMHQHEGVINLWQQTTDD